MSEAEKGLYLAYDASRHAEAAMERPVPLQTGGGGGTFGPMETRVGKLEARADSTDQRLGRIEDKLDRVIEKLGGMPTTNGLWGMIATVLGVGIGIAALTFAIAAYAVGLQP